MLIGSSQPTEGAVNEEVSLQCHLLSSSDDSDSTVEQSRPEPVWCKGEEEEY